MLTALQNNFTPRWISRMHGVAAPVVSSEAAGLRPLRSAIALAISALLAGPAAAALSDTIHPFAGVSYSYDDNLLRQADGGLPTEPKSDTAKSVVAGVSFERPVGRQLFTGSMKVSRVTFDRYNVLDYNGKDYALNWRWVVGNHLDGNAGVNYSQTLAPFSDFHSSERNLRSQRNEFAEGNWRFHPSWRVRGRFNREKYDYALSSQRYLDRTQDSSTIGFDYLAASGSTVGLQARHMKGSYQNPLRFGLFVVDDSYTQDDVQLKVYWRWTPEADVQVLAGRARRGHPQFAARDASGVNGRATANWTPTQQVKLSAALWREFTPFEGTTASYSLNKGSSINALWAVTSKIQANAQYQYLRRDFSGQGVIGVPSDARDVGRTSSVGLSYTPHPVVQLNVSAFHDQRTTSARFSSSYRANGASFSANLQF